MLGRFRFVKKDKLSQLLSECQTERMHVRFLIRWRDFRGWRKPSCSEYTLSRGICFSLPLSSQVGAGEVYRCRVVHVDRAMSWGSCHVEQDVSTVCVCVEDEVIVSDEDHTRSLL